MQSAPLIAFHGNLVHLLHLNVQRDDFGVMAQVAGSLLYLCS